MLNYDYMLDKDLSLMAKSGAYAATRSHFNETVSCRSNFFMKKGCLLENKKSLREKISNYASCLH